MTAEDAQGNLAHDTITVTATLPDIDGPSILVTSLATTHAFTSSSSPLVLTGTAADLSGVQTVSWTNDRGGSDAATGTTSWSANIPLFEGLNRITITASDTVGNESQTGLEVTFAPPDTTAPTVTILFPTDTAAMTTKEPMLNLSGTSGDDRLVTGVRWADDRGGSGAATGTTIWTANGIALQTGLNVITVTATDGSGNEGSDVLVVNYEPRASAIALEVSGSGRIKGALNGAPLENGSVYTLRAKPDAGHLFAGWSGGIVSSDPVLTFVMEDGLEISANFIANPFPVVAGSYRGLVETNPFAAGSSGSVSVQVTESGSFSAQLRLGAKTFAFTGAFDSQGRFAGRIHRDGRGPLSVQLALDLAGGTDRLTGLIADAAASAGQATTGAINADRATFQKNTNPAPDAGYYTVALRPATATLPAGNGFGSLTVGRNGSVRFAGQLGDGRAVSAGSKVSKNHTWPVAAVPYDNGGALNGWVAFRAVPQTSDADGSLHWLRPRKPGAGMFAAGFEGDVDFIAARYARPGAGALILGLPAGSGNARMVFDGAGLAQPGARTMTVGADQGVTLTGAGKFRFSLDLSTGLFAGSLNDAGTGGKWKFSGALLNDTGLGLGLFTRPEGVGGFEFGR